jgi:hypothetical protein
MILLKNQIAQPYPFKSSNTSLRSLSFSPTKDVVSIFLRTNYA